MPTKLPNSQILQILLDSFCVGYEDAPDLDGHECSAPLQDADQPRTRVVIDNITYSVTARKEHDGPFWSLREDVAEGNRTNSADDQISEAQMLDEAQHFRPDA